MDGPIPNYADMISQEKVQELCPIEFQAFLDALRKDSFLLDEYGDEEDDQTYLEHAVRDDLMWKGKHDLYPKTITAWNKLRRAFKAATSKDGDEGLDLYVSYYDEDSDWGPNEDDLPSVVWQVGGMYVLSPAGKRMKKFITRKFYTQ